MRKYLPYLLAGIAAACVVLCCLVWLDTSVKPAQSPVEDDPTLQEPEPFVPKNPPIFTAEEYPKVDASLAIHPLVNALAADFLAVEESTLTYEYTATRTSDVYRNLIDGKVDVIFAAEISKEDKQYAKEKGVELEIIPATASAFVFIVNTENPVNGVSFSQLQDIYMGKITNWKELGGEDAEIIPYQRPTGSGSQTAMLNLVMKGKTMMTPPTEQVRGEMGELIDAIAEYDNSNQALGYSYFYYVNTMYKRDTIKMLAVDGIRPSVETIKNGDYPIYTNGYIVLRKDTAEDAPARRWVEQVMGERGRAIIEEKGYVPVSK